MEISEELEAEGMKVTLYTPKGAGHRPPGDGRKYSGKDLLMDAFTTYLGIIPMRITPREVMGFDISHYRTRSDELLSVVDGSALTSDAINCALSMAEGVAPRHENTRFIGSYYASAIGIFISAAYRHSSGKELVYDPEADVRLSMVGDRLPHDKTLIIRQGADIIGTGGMGIIINHGGTTTGLENSGGLSINMQIQLIRNMKEGAMIIDMANMEIDESPFNKKRDVVFIGRGEDAAPLVYECIGEMKDYINRLREKVKQSLPDDEIFGNIRGMDIEGDILRLLNESGRLKP